MIPKMNTFKRKAIEPLLRWGWVGLLLWLAVMVIGAGAQSLHTSGKAAAAIREYKRIQAEAVQPPRDADGRIRKLSQNNLFVASATQNKLPQCLAILGDAVLIGEQWYQKGAQVQGAEIVAVGPDFVTVLFDGKEQRMAPFDVEVNYGQTGRGQGAAGGGREGREGDRGMRGRGGQGGPPTVAAEEGRTPPQRGGAGPGSEMMDMRARIESMTPQQRQEMFERFRNASPEDRERMREEFRRGGNN